MNFKACLKLQSDAEHGPHFFGMPRSKVGADAVQDTAEEEFGGVLDSDLRAQFTLCSRQRHHGADQRSRVGNVTQPLILLDIY